MGYLANFMVYTLAMVGVIVVALLVFKNATSVATGGKSKYLKVVDTMSIAPRKTLYIVSAGSEKFLIAGDADKTTLISKLETNGESISVAQSALGVLSPAEKIRDEAAEIPAKMTSRATFQETMASLGKPSYMDKSNIGINSSLLSNRSPYPSVMKNLAEKMRG